ncbi:hypothetical protein BJV78DRAFT_1259919, partial [Lactifluus subvellereus]
MLYDTLLSLSTKVPAVLDGDRPQERHRTQNKRRWPRALKDEDSMASTLPPLVLPWVIERDQYNIKLPHIDTLLAVADKGRRPPRRIRLPIGPVPTGLYKTAQDTINCDVPKLAMPNPYGYYFDTLTPCPSPFFLLLSHVDCFLGSCMHSSRAFFCAYSRRM